MSTLTKGSHLFSQPADRRFIAFRKESSSGNLPLSYCICLPRSPRALPYILNFHRVPSALRCLGEFTCFRLTHSTCVCSSSFHLVPTCFHPNRMSASGISRNLHDQSKLLHLVPIRLALQHCQHAITSPPCSRWEEEGNAAKDPPQTYFLGLPTAFSATWYPGLHL